LYELVVKALRHKLDVLVARLSLIMQSFDGVMPSFVFILSAVWLVKEEYFPLLILFAEKSSLYFLQKI
jgi:hypothetical protein